MRKRTGLRNRFRTGKSTYCTKRKAKLADRYGQWDSGRRRTPEVINGSLISYEPRREAVK